MSKIRFSAASLQDIADHFDSIAQAHADAAAQAKSERARNSHMAQATAWRAASGYLNHCELTPALAVIS